MTPALLNPEDISQEINILYYYPISNINKSQWSLEINMNPHTFLSLKGYFILPFYYFTPHFIDLLPHFPVFGP